MFDQKILCIFKILPKEQPEETFKNNQILNDQSEEMLNCLQINSSGESFKIPIYKHPNIPLPNQTDFDYLHILEY